MIEKLRGIRIKGRCFSAKTSLMFFNKEKFRISIIYGKNGSGKSTLSKAIQNSESDLSTETISRDNTTLLIPESNIAVFNEDFIKRKVDVKGEGLDAVILFGEQNELNSKIQKHKDQINDIMALRDAEEQKTNSFEDSKNISSPNHKISKIKERLRSKDGWITREQKLRGKNTNLTAIALWCQTYWFNI